MRKALILTLALLFSVTFLIITGNAASEKTDLSESCEPCHAMRDPQLVKAFKNSAHKKLECVACHTKTHDEVWDKQFRTKIWNNKCKECHKDKDVFKKHDVSKKKCINCHGKSHDFKAEVKKSSNANVSPKQIRLLPMLNQNKRPKKKREYEVQTDNGKGFK